MPKRREKDLDEAYEPRQPRPRSKIPTTKQGDAPKKSKEQPTSTSRAKRDAKAANEPPIFWDDSTEVEEDVFDEEYERLYTEKMRKKAILRAAPPAPAPAPAKRSAASGRQYWLFRSEPEIRYKKEEVHEEEGHKEDGHELNVPLNVPLSVDDGHEEDGHGEDGHKLKVPFSVNDGHEEDGHELNVPLSVDDSHEEDGHKLKVPVNVPLSVDDGHEEDGPKPKVPLNVPFSVDDLAAETEPIPWDSSKTAGRSIIALNYMRDMRKGDLAFFYHDNCETPAIVGIMEIVTGPSIDPSGIDDDDACGVFILRPPPLKPIDPEDPENPENLPDPFFMPSIPLPPPEWLLVHVTLKQKLETPITFKQMEEWRQKKGHPLRLMRILVAPGLVAVSKVEKKEWKFLVGEMAKNGDTIAK
ncbi:hypothetical protein EG329_013253 [Mollisiaceae sp. DMI_Dod_QoI]|nr:hypothetical protein EG329_013253 [Helotiales sp. DMI_Dod_QoI]